MARDARRSTFVTVGLSAVAALLCLPSGAAFGSQASSPKTLIIDGSKNPERFPQWFAWETAFRMLPASRLDPAAEARVLKDLGVSELELALIIRETNEFRRAEARLIKALQSTLSSLKGAREEQLRAATKPINLAYRHEVLDAKGRLQLGLSDDSWHGLNSWIDRVLSRTTLRLSGGTLEYFHEPW